MAAASSVNVPTMIILTLLIAIASYFGTLLVVWIYRRNYKQKIFKRYGIPGPNPSFLTGNLQQLKAASTPNDAFSKWIEKHGNVVGYFIGEMPYLLINDIEVLKQIMIKDFNIFTNRTPLCIPKKPLSDSLLGLPSSRWREVRSVLTPTFSSSKIKLLFKIINDKVITAVEVVNEKALQSESFDIHSIMKCLALDVIADSALAMKVNSLKNPNDSFLAATDNFFRTPHSGATNLAIIFPMIRNLFKFFAVHVPTPQMTNIIVQNLKSAIEYRRSNPNPQGTDLLQLLLDSSEHNVSDNEDNEKNVQLTDDEIIANAYIAVLAGYETTANALAYTFYLLTQNPDIQEKLYQELRTQCPAKDDFTYENITNIQYLDQVFSESLRMYPPVTGFITRACTKECQIGQYTIPKDVVVQVPVWRIHHDPDLWPDPWKFDPDRFSPENKNKIDKMSFLPFGIGPRSCIGNRFAILEAKLAIAHLVKTFEFVPCEKTEDPLILSCPTSITFPKNGVFLQARLRKQP